MLDQDDYVLVSYTYSMPDSNCNHNSFSCIRRTIAFQKFQEPINYSRKKMAFEISHIIDSRIICHSWLWCQLWSHGYWPLTLPNLQKKINIKGWTLHFRHGLLLHSITQNHFTTKTHLGHCWFTYCLLTGFILIDGVNCFIVNACHTHQQKLLETNTRPKL